jgi:hypothetical protein
MFFKTWKQQHFIFSSRHLSHWAAGATPIAQIKYAHCALTARELPVHQYLCFPWRVVQHELCNALPRQPAPARTSSSCSFSSRLVSVSQVIRPRRVFNSLVGNFAIYIVLYLLHVSSCAVCFCTHAHEDHMAGARSAQASTMVRSFSLCCTNQHSPQLLQRQNILL